METVSQGSEGAAGIGIGASLLNELHLIVVGPKLSLGLCASGFKFIVVASLFSHQQFMSGKVSG